MTFLRGRIFARSRFSAEKADSVLSREISSGYLRHHQPLNRYRDDTRAQCLVWRGIAGDSHRRRMADLCKSLLLLCLAPEGLNHIFQRMHYGDHMFLYLAPSFVIGLYLTWAGFTAPTQRGL